MTLCPTPSPAPTGDHFLIGNLTGFRYFGLFGTDDTQSLANIADAGSPATKVGTPTYGVDHMETTSNAASTLKSIDTPYSPEPGEDWFIWLVATRETSGAYLSANGTNSDGINVDESGLWGGSSGPSFRNGFASATGQATAAWPSSSTTDFFSIFAWGQDGGHAFIQIGSGGALGPIVAGTGLQDIPRRPGSTPMQLNPDGEGNVPTNFHLCAMGSRICDEAERLAMYVVDRDYANGRGNIVVE